MEVVRHLGSPVGSLAFFSLAILLGMAVYGLRFAVFDRYYWPLLPVVAILLLRRPRRSGSDQWPVRPRVGVYALVGLASIPTAFLAIIFMLNSLAFDAARWKAGEQLTGLGVTADEVDAGYEWVGYYQGELPSDNGAFPSETFYEMLWPGRRECGVVSGRFGYRAGYDLVAATSYRLFLFAGPDVPLYLYRAANPGECRTVTPSNPA